MSLPYKIMKNKSTKNVHSKTITSANKKTKIQIDKNRDPVLRQSAPQTPNNFIIWVCETPPIILYGDVEIFPRFLGKRDVTHLIYVKIKPYLITVVFGKDGSFISTLSKRHRTTVQDYRRRFADPYSIGVWDADYKCQG